MVRIRFGLVFALAPWCTSTRCLVEVKRYGEWSDSEDDDARHEWRRDRYERLAKKCCTHVSDHSCCALNVRLCRVFSTDWTWWTRREVDCGRRFVLRHCSIHLRCLRCSSDQAWDVFSFSFLAGIRYRRNIFSLDDRWHCCERTWRNKTVSIALGRAVRTVLFRACQTSVHGLPLAVWCAGEEMRWRQFLSREIHEGTGNGGIEGWCW